jgi:hypothetical protein
MRLRIAAGFLAAMAALVVSGSAGAALGVYRNSMESTAQRAQVVKLSGDRCARGGSDHALRITIGKSTPECAYRTPVIGRDLEVAAIGRLLDTTPKPIQRKAYLAVNLRAGGAGARYQLAVFPLQRKAQLRRVGADGRIRYLHVAHGVRARGLNQANEIRLQAFNVTKGSEKGNCHILAFVGGQLVADVTDPSSGELQGRTSGVSLGVLGNAKGAVGSFDDVVVRVPSPF